LWKWWCSVQSIANCHIKVSFGLEGELYLTFTLRWSMRERHGQY
jgi:hypothetical protein